MQFRLNLALFGHHNPRLMRDCGRIQAGKGKCGGKMSSNFRQPWRVFIYNMQPKVVRRECRSRPKAGQGVKTGQAVELNGKQTL